MALSCQRNSSESKMVSRRQFVARIGAIGVSAVVGASLVSTTATAAPLQGPVYQAQRTVSLWHIFSTLGSQEDAMKAVVTNFEQTHSGIRVDVNEVQREDIKVLAPAVMRTSRAPD